MENTNDMRHRLLGVVQLTADYCVTLENCFEMDRSEFTDRVLSLLPRIYWEFFDISTDDIVTLGEDEYFADYVDEDMYEGVRSKIAALMGEHDVFLETFEEDMKYSDTPIASSISECLADLYQPLFNFTQTVKETDGANLDSAFITCKEMFAEYWSQTLCNVLRALNHIKYQAPADDK